MLALDPIDRRIVMLLQEDAKMNVKAIALKVGLTSTPTYDRIKRLEKAGIIRRYTAEINREKAGLGLLVFCQVTLQAHSRQHIRQFEKAVQEIVEVIGCFHIAGNFDYLLKIVVPNIQAYQSLLTHKLSVLESVATIQSNLVMSAVKEHTVLHMPD